MERTKQICFRATYLSVLPMRHPSLLHSKQLQKLEINSAFTRKGALLDDSRFPKLKRATGSA